MKRKLKRIMESWSKASREKDFEELVHQYMADVGKSETLAGELLSAVNRIAYRYFNDGDMIGSEGQETVNCAYRYIFENFTDILIKIIEIENTPLDPCEELFKQIRTTTNYEEFISDLIDGTVSYLDKHEELFEEKNEDSFLDYYENSDEDYMEEDDEEDLEDFNEDFDEDMYESRKSTRRGSHRRLNEDFNTGSHHDYDEYEIDQARQNKKNVKSAARMIEKLKDLPRNIHIALGKTWGPDFKLKSASEPTYDGVNIKEYCKIYCNPDRIDNNDIIDLNGDYSYSQELYYRGIKIGIINYYMEMMMDGYSDDVRDWCKWEASFTSVNNECKFKSEIPVAFFWFNDYKYNSNAVEWNRLPLAVNAIIAVDGEELVKPVMMTDADFDVYVVRRLKKFADKYVDETAAAAISDVVDKYSQNSKEYDETEISSRPGVHKSRVEDTFDESYRKVKVRKTPGYRLR